MKELTSTISMASIWSFWLRDGFEEEGLGSDEAGQFMLIYIRGKSLRHFRVS